MKKTLSLILALVMVFALCACGKTAAPAPAPAAPAAEAPAAEAPVAEAPAAPVIDYTSKPVTVIVPFAAGGGQHVLATAVNAGTESVDMVINNVTGGGGAVGIMELLNSKNDGWTVGCSTINNVAAGAWNGAYPDPDAWKKVTPVASVAGDRMIMLASKASGYTSLEDIVAFSKENPGKLTVTGATANSYTQAVAELFMADLGVEWAYVPFDGETACRNAVMGGQVDLCIFGVGAAQTALQSGDCVGICLLAPQRSTYFPEIPTVGEIYPELASYDQTVYRCYYMPENTDPAIVDAFEAVLEECVSSQAFIDSMNGLFLEITYMNAEETTAMLETMVNDCQKMYEIMNG